MITDRELLELAAKAAGFDFVQWTAGTWTFGKETQCRPDGGDVWNPLDDDGDALRLAVKLQLDVDHNQDHACVYGHGVAIEIPVIGDQFAATRRAIVRAAAEIGRNMKGEAE